MLEKETKAQAGRGLPGGVRAAGGGGYKGRDDVADVIGKTSFVVYLSTITST